MTVRVACLIVALAACHPPDRAAAPPSNGGGTGGAQAPAIVLHLEQGPCMGRCPIYTLDLYDDGTLVYHGDSNVETKGLARTTIDAAGMQAIARVFAEARFFDLGDDGMLPRGPGVAGSVVMCTDTPHTTITYHQGDRARTLDDAHCEETDLGRLEGKLAPLLPTLAWVGGGE